MEKPSEFEIAQHFSQKYSSLFKNQKKPKKKINKQSYFEQNEHEKHILSLKIRLLEIGSVKYK